MPPKPHVSKPVGILKKSGYRTALIPPVREKESPLHKNKLARSVDNEIDSVNGAVEDDFKESASGTEDKDRSYVPSEVDSTVTGESKLELALDELDPTNLASFWSLFILFLWNLFGLMEPSASDDNPSSPASAQQDGRLDDAPIDGQVDSSSDSDIAAFHPGDSEESKPSSVAVGEIARETEEEKRKAKSMEKAFRFWEDMGYDTTKRRHEVKLANEANRLLRAKWAKQSALIGPVTESQSHSNQSWYRRPKQKTPTKRMYQRSKMKHVSPRKLRPWPKSPRFDAEVLTAIRNAPRSSPQKRNQLNQWHPPIEQNATSVFLSRSNSQKRNEPMKDQTVIQNKNAARSKAIDGVLHDVANVGAMTESAVQFRPQVALANGDANKENSHKQEPDAVTNRRVVVNEDESDPVGASAALIPPVRENGMPPRLSRQKQTPDIAETRSDSSQSQGKQLMPSLVSSRSNSQKRSEPMKDHTATENTNPVEDDLKLGAMAKQSGPIAAITENQNQLSQLCHKPSKQQTTTKGMPQRLSAQKQTAGIADVAWANVDANNENGLVREPKAVFTASENARLESDLVSKQAKVFAVRTGHRSNPVSTIEKLPLNVDENESDIDGEYAARGPPYRDDEGPLQKDELARWISSKGDLDHDALVDGYVVDDLTQRSCEESTPGPDAIGYGLELESDEEDLFVALPDNEGSLDDDPSVLLPDDDGSSDGGELDGALQPPSHLSGNGRTMIRRKNPAAPKRPLSAYNLFVKKERPKAKASLQDEKLPFTSQDVVRKLAEMWKGLSDSQKETWNEMAKIERDRFDRENEQFQGNLWLLVEMKKGPSVPKRPSSSDIL